MSLDIAKLYADSEADRFAVHTRHLNEQMVRVLKTLGYDVGFCRGTGQYLFDRKGEKYLDLLSGYGVFAIGRNHPALRDALESVLDADLPGLVQFDVSPLAGLLAQRLLGHMPYLDKVFFANSGTEAVEAAIKFARAATRRPGIIHCEHSFHGLTYGALSLNGDAVFRSGFEPLLPDCTAVPFNDLAALERALATRNAAAFIVEPIQGKGVNLPDDGYLQEAAALCRRHGTLFIADEIQTGLGRTGRFLAVEHWGVEPDMVLIAKALSGGHVPVGAVLTRKRIYDKIFDRMDRAVVHGSTFAKNDLAMAAGLATLDVIESERLVVARRAARRSAAHRPVRSDRALRVPARCPRQGADDRHRVRPAHLIEAQGELEPPGVRQQGAVLPADHHSAVCRAQDPDPGRRPRQPHHQAVVPAGHHRSGLRLDRERLRLRDRGDAPGARRDLVARQDAGRQCRGGAGVAGKSERAREPAQIHAPMGVAASRMT